MWKILLIFGIFFKVTLAVFGPECNVQKCASTLQNIKNLGHIIPDGDELKTICPDALEYIKCIAIEIETCHHQNLADLASSKNESVSGIANIFLGVSGLIIDLCDEHSTLHKKYVSHIICIRNTIDNAEVRQKCLAGASESYQNYAAIHRTFKKRDEHKDCFGASYVFACASEEVRKDCGKSSQELFMIVVKRTKLLKHSVCNPNAIVELKTTFFDFLELQGERRNIFKEAFDFRKKK